MSECRTHKVDPKSKGIWDNEDDNNDNDDDDQLHINYKAYAWHPFLILINTTKKLQSCYPKKKKKKQTN